MAVIKNEFQFILMTWCFMVAKGKSEKSKYRNSPGISFSAEVAATVIIGGFTIMFLIYWFVFRPLIQANKILRHNRINIFLLDFWRNDVLMKPPWNSKVYKDISSTVRCVIEDIIEEVFSSEDSDLFLQRENVGKLVELVGSCKDGSKVQRPDEFDFSVIFPTFSAVNVSVEHGSVIQPDTFMCIHEIISYEYDNAFVQLRYTGEINKKSKVFGLLTKVKNHYYISAFKVHSFFKSRIRSVVKRMILNKYTKACDTGSLTVEFPDEVKYNSEENGPAWKLPLYWKNKHGNGFRINVDIAPIIEISDQYDSISMTTFKDKAVSANRFISYPAICSMLGNDRYDYTTDIQQMQGGTFSLTYEDVLQRVSVKNKLFTELSFLTSHVHYENVLMKELKKSFKNVFITYQIFKRLEPMWSKFKVAGQLHGLRFHSYVLKTIILDEIINGSGKISRRDDIATCFKVILKIIIDKFESCLRGNHESITSLWFDEHILTCAQLPQVLIYDEEYLHAFRQQFQLIWNLLNNVAEDDAYEYKRYQNVILDLISRPANFRIGMEL